MNAVVSGSEQDFWAVCSLDILVGNTRLTQEPKEESEWLCSRSGYAILKANSTSDIQMVYILPSKARKFDIKLVAEDLTKYDVELPDE